MLFTHNGFTENGERYYIAENAVATGSLALAKEEFYSLWQGYSSNKSTLSISEGNENTFAIGPPITCDNADDYTINISSEGVFIAAKDEKNLCYGFFTLIDMIEIDDDGAPYLPCGTFRESAGVSFRMVHLCVFPETELSELRRNLRLCAALKYTHVVLEFWGMIKYDCLSSLAWKNAYSKDEIRPLIREANALGLEIIPMLNHWGHATAGRVMHGKHVVLDQAPELSHLFECEGWCWRIKSEKVKNLLSVMRTELIELCGNGEYFHIGCDEAYGFEYTDENVNDIASYINSVAKELEKAGRKTIMWADMMLSPHSEYNKKNNYSVSAPNNEYEEKMISLIDKKIIAADWQYWTPEYPIETSVMLKDKGFDVLICPYDVTPACTNASVKTVKEHGLSGIIHTTWHTLSSGMHYIGRTADAIWSGEYKAGDADNLYRIKTAAALRKAAPSGGQYKYAGWAKKQVSTRWI